MPINEQVLVKKAKNGDHEAFKMIVHQQEAQVRATVIAMLGDTSQADDVAQEVFIRFYRSLSQFKGKAKLSTYLSRIAINLSLNELKRRQKKQSRWAGMSREDGSVVDVEDFASNPMRQDQKDLVHQGLQALEADFRSVIVLRLIDGYSVKETADILGLPMGTVASRLARAQLKLKDIILQLEIK